MNTTNTTGTTGTKREKFDLKRPDARTIADRIVHGAFITEGTMAAFPTCFPAVTTPLPGDESHLTALDVAPDGMLYAGTSGRAAHLLVGMFHGVTGMVFDMGTVPGATRCTGIACGKERFLAAANGPAGGTLIGRKLEPLPFDLIQEWHVARKPLEPVAAPLEGEPVVHVLAAGVGELAVVSTPTRLLTVDLATSAVRVIGAAPGSGPMARGSKGGIFARDERDTLWRFDPASGKLERRAVALPAAEADAKDRTDMRGWMSWARDTIDGTLYTADAAGRLYAFSEDKGFSAALAQVPAPPVGPMAVTLDGRVYGTFGAGMSMLFVLDPARGTLRTLGVAASTLERRRYGYSFAAAATGRDGQIFFGEDDDLGHVFMYFPRIQPKVVAT